jgi:uncharacterized membrane protein YhaH (DUF805 family)
MEWYLKVVRDNYANFNGRAGRQEFWMFYLFNFIFGIVAMVADNILGTVFTFGEGYYEVRAGSGWITLLYTIALFIPILAATVRRLHDTNRSGFWLLYPLLAYIPILLSGFSLYLGIGLELGIFIMGISFLALFGLTITLFVFTVLDSTPGTNNYGPSPTVAMSVDRNCTKCGSENPADAMFCQSCGATINEEPA